MGHPVQTLGTGWKCQWKLFVLRGFGALSKKHSNQFTSTVVFSNICLVCIPFNMKEVCFERREVWRKMGKQPKQAGVNYEGCYI